jgi:hypothetical protein
MKKKRKMRLELPIVVILLLILASSCSEVNVYRNELILVDGIYNIKVDKKLSPFSGKVISNYKSGELASEIEFKEGYPLGNGYHYGYINDVIAEEIYELCNCEKLIKSNHSLLRINKLLIKEGEKTIDEVFNIIYTHKMMITSKEHEEILTLINKCMNGERVAKNVEIRYSTGEFERPFEIKHYE